MRNPFAPRGPEPFTPNPMHGGGFLPSLVDFLKKRIDELFRKSVFTVNHVAPGPDNNVDVEVSGADADAVHYSRADGKTDEQKIVARANMGVMSVAETMGAIAAAKHFPVEVTSGEHTYIISIYDDSDEGIGFDISRKGTQS